VNDKKGQRPPVDGTRRSVAHLDEPGFGTDDGLHGRENVAGTHSVADLRAGSDVVSTTLVREA